MHLRRLIATIIAGVAVLWVSAAVWSWQNTIGAALRAELESARSQSRLGSRLQNKNESLTGVQLSSAELARLQAERVMLMQLRGEIETLKQKVAASRNRMSAAPKSRAKQPVHSLSDAWRDRGRSTPEATLETALWSAAGGDVEALAACLDFSPAARAKALALYESLPVDIRARHRTPEQFIALLTTDAIRYRAMTIVVAANNRKTSSLVVDFETPEGERRSVQLALSRTDEEWRLQVPESAIDRYTAMLKTPESAR